MTEETLLTADIPQKFIDPDTGAVRMDDFAKSYRELEKQFSARPNAPKSHEDYFVQVDHGLFEADETVNKRLHAKGMSQEQVQEVYDLASDILVPIIAEITADAEADRQVEKLIAHFGGVQQWKTVSKQLLAFGQKALPPEVLENMTQSFEGVMALHRLMQSEEPSLAPQAEDSLSSASDEKELQSMMRDPRYWRDRDPAFVKQVTEGFKARYNG